MTHEEACKIMHDQYLCGSCDRKKSMSYRPLRNSEGKMIGITDVQTACFYRSPMEEKGIDGKCGIHSITTPDACTGYRLKKETEDAT